MDLDGIKRVGDEEVGRIANNYFSTLFTSPGCLNLQDALAGVEQRVSDSMNARLRARYSEEEVHQALKQMHPLKAPGPDGMCLLFFQTYWHIVGASVTNMVLAVLNGEALQEGINKTFIVLIPKKKDAESMSDFRPISLCNVMYKLV